MAWDDWSDAADWGAPQPFDYFGLTVVPVFDPYYQQWGFWEFGIWIPLAAQPPSPYGYGY